MVCLHPVKVDGKYFPCGRCLPCRIAKRDEWILRLALEARYSRFTYAGTLTYDNQHLKFETPDALLPTLSKRDIQLFLKRLRKEIAPAKIRYFVAGEYGGQNLRPHYHFLIFSEKMIDKRHILDAWRQGFVQMEPASDQAVRYVAKYANKIEGRLIERVKMFRLPLPWHMQSQGLGKAFLKEHRYTLFHDFCFRFGDHVVGLPRYFVRRIEKDAEKGDFPMSLEEVKRWIRDKSEDRRSREMDREGAQGVGDLLVVWDRKARDRRARYLNKE